MLQSLRVEGFQSLRNVNFALSKYTVIVGRSSSGKSALTRALRLLCFGGRGTGYVSYGAKNAKVLASFRDGRDEFGVETTRGKDNQYEVFAPDVSSADPEVYVKLAGAVPESVERLLKITELSFADQFDKPYLLSATGSEVARSLGELTEVTRIFAAVREGNRRRSATASLLSTRRSDLAQAQEAVEAFAALPAQVKALSALEERWRAVREQAHRRDRLADALGRVEVSEAALRGLGESLPVVPSLDEVEESARKLARFKEIVRTMLTAQAGVDSADREATTLYGEVIPALMEEMRDVLEAAGECPTCGAKAEAWELTTVG